MTPETPERGELSALIDDIQQFVDEGEGADFEQVKRWHKQLAALRALRSPAPGAGGWQWPVDTVGKMISWLSTLPMDMPLYTAYFVKVNGESITKTRTPSLSKETVSDGRIQKYKKDGPQTLVLWASQDERAAAPKPEPQGEADERLRYVFSKLHAGSKTSYEEWLALIDLQRREQDG